MNLRQLEIFRAVMQAGTTSGAAHILGISQPAVSNMIRHMEAQSGIKLFNRYKGRLWPTEEAGILNHDVESIFVMFRSVSQKLQDLRESRVGSIKIVSVPSLAQSVLLSATRSFLVDRPNVSISLDLERMEGVINRVDHNLADFGLTLAFSGYPSIEAKPMHLGCMVCIMPANHPLAELETVRAADIRKHAFITMERGTPLGSIVANAFTTAGEDFSWVVETRYSNMAYSLVETGLGVALIDEYYARSHASKHVVVRPFVPTIPLTVYVLFSRLRPLPSLAKALIREIENAFLDLSAPTRSK
ncbi:MAG: LysR family transcriptional regulator [Rhodospirillales bacterium]|jgi:DNA-binding transcriptional LysR family regulator|nr:LysR family transcriptional regulator [Rhodospirillales bacterium]